MTELNQSVFRFNSIAQNARECEMHPRCNDMEIVVRVMSVPFVLHYFDCNGLERRKETNE